MTLVPLETKETAEASLGWLGDWLTVAEKEKREGGASS